MLLLGFIGTSSALVLLFLVPTVAHIHNPAPIPTEHPAHHLMWITFVPAFLAGLAAQVWALQLVLRKTFTKFSVRLVKNS
jgi:hypothetical protein